MDERSGPGLRPGLRRVATGLIAYGLVGLVVAAIGLGAVAWVNGKMDSLAGNADARVLRLTDTLDHAAQALQDAGTTATSVGGTLDVTNAAVIHAAGALRAVQPRLMALGTQFRSIDILGSQPLGKAADAIDGIVTQMDGLDGRLDSIGSALTENRAKVAINAASLTATGTSLSGLSTRLKDGVVTDSVDDVRAVILVILFLMIIWTMVPAVGALAVGIWLRRETDRPA